MLYGLGISCLDRFLGRIFSHFVRTRMGVLGIDTFSRACSFPGSFGPCAGLQGVNYAPWPQYPALCGPAGCELCSMASVSPVWTAFWAAFFHNWCRQFPALCSPAGCELCSMALVLPVWTAFWAVFFHNLCGQFPALCIAAGCELCSMASISHVWTAFWAAFFHNLCGQEWSAWDRYLQ